MSDEVLETLPETPSHASSLNTGIIAQLVGINLLWGGSSVAAKSALDELQPFTLASCRFLPIGFAFLVLLRLRGTLPRVPRQDYWNLFLFAFFGITLTYSLYFIGIQNTTASDASLLIACEPIFIALFALVFLKERLSVWQWGGMLIGILGVGLIVGQAWGNALALLSLCFEASVSVIGKRLLDRYPGTFLLGVQMLLGGAMLVPFAMVEVAHHAPKWDGATLGGLLYLMLVCSCLCYSVWYRCLKHCPVSLLGAFLLIQPMVGPFYGWLLRGEMISWRSGLGGFLIVSGIGLVVLAQRRSTKP